MYHRAQRGPQYGADVAFRQYGTADLFTQNGTLNPQLFFRTTDATPAPDLFRCLYVENGLQTTSVLFWGNLQASGFPMIVRPNRFRLFLITETTVITLQAKFPTNADSGFVNVYGLGFYLAPTEGANS